MARILSIILLPLSLTASHALRGSRITNVSRRLQESPTVSPTRADATILDISGDTDPQEEGATGGEGGISWLGEEHIAATATPPSTGGADGDGLDEVTIDNATASLTSPTNVTSNEIDAPIDSPEPAEFDQASLDETITASTASGITNATPIQAGNGSVAPLDSLEAEPSETIATTASSIITNPIEDANAIINVTNNSATAPPSDAQTTTIAPEGSATISNTQSTTSDSIGLNDETTPSPIDNASTSTSSSSTTTPYEDQWETDVDDETNNGDNQTSYNWYDEETTDDEEGNNDPLEGKYPQQDDETSTSSYPWNDDSPSYQPTPRPTHQSYTSPNDDILDDESESSQYEFNDDLKNNIQTAEEKVKEYLDGVESPEEMEKDVNVQVVAGVLTVVFVILWLTTAWQVMENPDGVCASFCRLTLKFIGCTTRILFLPCRYMCCKDSQQSMGRRSHAPMRAPFPSDLELS